MSVPARRVCPELVDSLDVLHYDERRVAGTDSLQRTGGSYQKEGGGQVRLVLSGVGKVALLGLGVLLCIPGMADDSQRSGWYVGAGVGASWISDMKQAGWNRDTICYPVDDCSNKGSIEGYRWFYDLDADRGSLFEFSVGRMFGNLRLELSANRRKNDIDQKFTGIIHFDGTQILSDSMSSYTSDTTVSIDHLRTHTLQLNAYYDFPLARSRITPYIGAGVGVSHVKLYGLFFRSEYACTSGCNAGLSPPEAYNSLQDEDLSDSVFSKHLHAGVDYSFRDGLLLGLKLTYSEVDDMRDSGHYIDHPLPDESNHTKISDMDHWSLTLGLKYLFGS